MGILKTVIFGIVVYLPRILEQFLPNMKKISTLLVFALSLCAITYAQTIPNMDLEDWADSPSGNFEEPTGGYWATANAVKDLFPALNPATTFKDTDAQSGTYSCRLVTDEIPVVGTLVTGTLTTGEFDAGATPGDNMKFGQPYAFRPVTFKGWYKFNPVGGDSAALYTLLTKWNAAAGKRDTVGEARVDPKSAVTTWTEWSAPFVYSSTDMPDTIVMVFASSSAGNIFVGEVGTEMKIDNISLSMETGLSQIFMPEVSVKTFPNPATDQMKVELDKPLKSGTFQVFDNMGKLIKEVAVNKEAFSLNVADLPAGTYHYMLLEGSDAMNSGSFLVH